MIFDINSTDDIAVHEDWKAERGVIETVPDVESFSIEFKFNRYLTVPDSASANWSLNVLHHEMLHQAGLHQAGPDGLVWSSHLDGKGGGPGLITLFALTAGRDEQSMEYTEEVLSVGRMDYESSDGDGEGHGYPLFEDGYRTSGDGFGCGYEGSNKGGGESVSLAWAPLP